MARLLVLANLELALECPEGSDPEVHARLTERRLLRALRKIASESGAKYEEATLLPGVKAYTDRRYLALEVPKELHGETFIRSANNDADPDSGTSLTVTLRFPSTVFVADDERGERVPRWMAAHAAQLAASTAPSKQGRPIAGN